MVKESFELTEETFWVIREIGGHMPGGFFIYKAEEPEELVYANKAVFEIYGCADEDEFRELTGYTFRGMVHPEDYDSISESITHQVNGVFGKMDHAEYRIIRKDGAVRWVDDYGHYTRAEAYGGIYVVFISDITEKLREREEDTAVRDAVIATLTNAYNTVWLINDLVTEKCSLYHTDMDDAHAEAIRNALSHACYTDTKTQYVATMVAEKDQGRMQEQIGLPYILEQFETKDQFSVSFVRDLETGPRHYRIDFGKVYMPGGRIGAMMGFKDVDDEVRKELAVQEQLHEQELRQKELNSMITAMASDYRSVYHVDIDADDAVCYRADPDDPRQTPEGIHFPYHARFLEYCDLYVDDEFKEGFRSFIDPDNVRDALADENIIVYRYLARRDGVEYYEMLRMAGVRHPSDRDDHIVHAVGMGFTVIDAEMREALAKSHAVVEALKAAEDANRAKTAFLSSMSHEIRTPMNAIIGLGNIALSDETVSGSTREYLEKIDSSAHHLLGIINDILDMSRIESGRMVIRSEEFSFAKILEQVNTIIGGQCRDKSLSYECHTDGIVKDFYVGDEMKIRQMMINILGNSVKFTPEGGKVALNVGEVANYDGKSTLRFVFSDTGIGMSEDFLPRLFDPFAQEDSSSTSKYGSTGLGMPITKSIVEMMNGDIEVKSEKGKGTTFIVTLTLVDSNRKGEAVEDGMLKPHELCVLVIDDDPIACKHAQVVLGKVGISCEAAESGSEGVKMVKLRHARMAPYDLILVDWKMPEMDGLETTRQIRAAVGDETPVIILTSYNWEDIADEAKKAGVDTFVSKPLFAGSVMDEFREAFKRKNVELERGTADLKGRRILLAEDVPVNAEIIMMVLAMREMEVDHAEDGKVAVDMFMASELGYYDAILMDMRMPVMGGLEASRIIRAAERSDATKIPIIALTANAFDEDVQRSMQAGLNAHLSKPVEPEALFETLERLIDEV
ncbi:MAG: response regulator [Eggerthellaceae bacterium]|nr:response regulator [Eggerthellaceae bacterium]